MKAVIDNEAVKLALAGIIKSPTGIFFTVDPATGHHVRLSVSERLATIGLSHNHIGPIFNAFSFPEAAYYSESMRHADEVRGKRRGKQPRVRLAVEEIDSYDFADYEAGEDVTHEEVKAGNNKRSKHYYLGQQGRFWGVFNALDTGQVLFPEREQAEQYLEDLLHHRGGFRAYYGGNN